MGPLAYKLFRIQVWKVRCDARTCSAWLTSSNLAVLVFALLILWRILPSPCTSLGDETFLMSVMLSALLAICESLFFKAPAIIRCLKTLILLSLLRMAVP